MGSRYCGTPDEVRALNAYIKLVRATESVTSRLQRRLNEAGLTLSQFGVLEALLHLGSLSQKELAEKLLKSGGNMTLVIDNLEKRNLVQRQRQADDRRIVTVSLTESGLQLIGQLFPQHVADIVTEMSILTADEQDELGRLCKRLGKRE